MLRVETWKRSLVNTREAATAVSIQRALTNIKTAATNVVHADQSRGEQYLSHELRVDVHPSYDSVVSCHQVHPLVGKRGRWEQWK